MKGIYDKCLATKSFAYSLLQLMLLEEGLQKFQKLLLPCL